MGRYVAVGMAGGIVIGLLVAFLGMYGSALLRSAMQLC